MSQEVIAYRKHMNLKLAANELGIAWQTLYCRLKQLGEPVIGDKLRYGSDRDKLSAMAEIEFKRLVPFAINNNAIQFQSKYDFMVAGWKVDVKASMPRQLNRRFAALSWSFSFKKQSLICDFICCFCFDEAKALDRILLVPSEFFRGLQTVSVSCAGGSKWLDYEITADDLAPFFAGLPPPEGV
jgi:hypothetical protein